MMDKLHALSEHVSIYECKAAEKCLCGSLVYRNSPLFPELEVSHTLHVANRSETWNKSRAGTTLYSTSDSLYMLHW